MINKESKELIAFYNVENLFSPDPPSVHRLNPTLSGLRNWDERRYRDKIFKISQVFQLIQDTETTLPMLIGLAEVQGKTPLNDLISMAPFNSKYGVVHYDSMDERGVDVALLYDKNKIELLYSEPINYIFKPEENQSENYDTTRDVLFCKVKYLGQLINVFVLHLPSKRKKDVNKPKRDYILQDLRKKILDITSKNEAVIICGDFNENPDDESLNTVLYDDNFNKTLTNPYLDLYQNEIFSTFHFKDGLLFDQILISKEFFQQKFILSYEKAMVFNPKKISNRDKKFFEKPFRTYAGTRYLGGYSDHFPVIVIFKNI